MIRPLMRMRKWKLDLSAPSTPEVPPNTAWIPEIFEDTLRYLLIPGAYFLLISLRQEFMDKPYTVTNKRQSIWLCATSVLFQGTVAGCGILRGLPGTNIQLAGIPLAVFGMYTIEKESWWWFTIYTIGQIFLSYKATIMATRLQIPPWVLPAFLSILFMNSTVCLHNLYKISGKERYMLKLQAMLDDMQKGDYYPEKHARK